MRWLTADCGPAEWQAMGKIRGSLRYLYLYYYKRHYYHSKDTGESHWTLPSEATLTQLVEPVSEELVDLK